MPTKQYFRVSAVWMNTYGFEDTHGQSKVFEVLRYRNTPTAFDNIVVLKCPHTVTGEWNVYEGRGHYVGAYTLILSDGLFMPAPADVEERGADIKAHAEFDTFESAQAHAIQLNEAIRQAYVANIPKAPVEDIPHGQFVRRLGRDGMPMAKTYRRELFDTFKQRYPIVDPLDSDKTLYVPRGTLLATEEALH